MVQYLPAVRKHLGSAQSHTACPWVNAYLSEPGLGDHMLLVTFDFFHVFVRDFFMVLFLWGGR